MKIEKADTSAVYRVTGIHDGFLCGIEISDEKSLQLNFKSFEGKRYSVYLGEILSLKADNFREGNIVLDIDLYEPNACPTEFLRQVYDYDEQVWEQYLPRIQKRLDEVPWFLFQISATYGCELLALLRGTISNIIIRS